MRESAAGGRSGRQGGAGAALVVYERWRELGGRSWTIGHLRRWQSVQVWPAGCLAGWMRESAAGARSRRQAAAGAALVVYERWRELVGRSWTIGHRWRWQSVQVWPAGCLAGWMRE